MNRRDDNRFEALVRAHAGAVSAYARALTSDPGLAEEAVQETFLRAWRFQDSFRGEGSFEGWLLRICRNCLIDLAHRAARAGRTRPDDELPEVAVPADHRHEVYDLLARLPLAQREVLVVCGILGWDYDSAAALLGVPTGTVRSRLHRARAALADLLGHDAAGPQREETA